MTLSGLVSFMTFRLEERLRINLLQDITGVCTFNAYTMDGWLYLGPCR